MKTKAVVYGVVFVVVVLVGVCSFAAEKNKYGFYEPIPNEECYGTWVNTEYSGGAYLPQKFVDYHWGSYDVFMIATREKPSFKGSSMIIDKWKDAEGNTWYKMYAREDWSTTKRFFSLERVSKDGKVKEFVWGNSDFPTEDDLKSKNLAAFYRIYYRQ